MTKKPYKSLFQYESEKPNFGYPNTSLQGIGMYYPLGSKRMQPRKKHFCSGNKSQANVFAGQGKKRILLDRRSKTVGSNLGKSVIL